ncbi:GNAT family N-acetyltransferase [Anabaena sp. FACHB-1237]|uniref:GNAT family N-acetyltransferase n=1 Tax=Anabaena sp. FACHB-1237 TaxID=2692769 RepID=UPI0016800032|nr:GNAT family N-acetyltransferase [Anabaena sp. FACHB-1237]MBD2137334.1 GNAT family N-acetyltransferase [Anabaena sp. FACHB-1237]
MKQLLAFCTWLFRFNSVQPSHYRTSHHQNRHNFYSGQMEIRRATLDDLMSVAQIIAESFHSQTGFWGWAFPLFRLGIYEDLRHRLVLSLSHHVCLVVVDVSDGKIIGTAELAVKFIDVGRWGQKSCPYLSNLAVKPEYRRIGVASNLLTKCEEITQCWGYEDLYLHVLEKNASACQLYLKLQYDVSHIDSYWKGIILNSSRQMLLHKKISRITQVTSYNYKPFLSP